MSSLNKLNFWPMAALSAALMVSAVEIPAQAEPHIDKTIVCTLSVSGKQIAFTIKQRADALANSISASVPFGYADQYYAAALVQQVDRTTNSGKFKFYKSREIYIYASFNESGAIASYKVTDAELFDVTYKTSFSLMPLMGPSLNNPSTGACVPG